MRRLEWSILLALTACVGPDDIDDANDRDRDGYAAFQAGGDDCNDGDAAVNPGADEVCGNEVDDDCDGFVDDLGLGGSTWYADVDLDGFGADATAVQACTQPVNHVAVAGDCNDAVAAINPDATEIWYDGTDQDCDGADDYDQDDDGFPSAEHATGGTDCDDLAVAVNPGATEVCDNLVDDDCDGGHDGCDWSGTVTPRDWTITTGTAATPFVSAGDVDGDGTADLAVWLPDASEVRLFWGYWSAVDMGLLDAVNVLTMPAVQAGYSLAVSIEQDLTGDGGADLVVGTWKPGTAGEVRMFTEIDVDTEPFDHTAALRTWTGPANGSTTLDGFGSRVVSLGPVPGTSFGGIAYPYRTNTDAYRCLLHPDAPAAGVADVTSNLLLNPCASVVPGPMRTQGDTFVLARVGSDHYIVDPASSSDVDPTDEPEANLWPNTVLADVLRVVPDVNGDGYDEVTAVETNSANPAVRMVYGPVSSTTPPAKVFRVEADPAEIEDFLDLDAADVNGDGLLDLLVLMDLAFTGDPGATAVGVLLAPFDWDQRGDVDRSTFDAVVDLPTGERASSLIPADVDGDGYTDLVLPGPGQVRVYFGEGR